MSVLSKVMSDKQTDRFNQNFIPRRFVIVANPMIHANLMALSFIELKLWQSNFYIAGIGIFDFMLLWSWPWPDDLHIWTWPVFLGDTPDVQIWTSYIKAFESYPLTYIHTYRQTRPKLYTTPLRRWSTNIDAYAHRNAISLSGNCNAMVICYDLFLFI